MARNIKTKDDFFNTLQYHHEGETIMSKCTSWWLQGEDVFFTYPTQDEAKKVANGFRHALLIAMIRVQWLLKLLQRDV